jgi:guanine deaminase
MTRRIFRAPVYHMLDDPMAGGPDSLAMGDALVVEDGRIVEVAKWTPALAREPVVTFPGAMIVPGFVDAHVHYPQIDVIGAPAAHLLDWLNHNTFPSELAFADRDFAARTACFFLDQLLRHGTTTALIYPTVHKHSVDVLFEAALARNMRIASGKVLMDRNAPDGLLDTAATGYRDSRDLIHAWHGKGRLTYAVTPRFAATSTEEQLALAGRLLREHPGTLLHTHLSENHEEIAYVESLFPDCADYLQIYEKFGLATDRSVFAHCLHLSDAEWTRLGAAGSAVAFCPTSNLFLGSGLFDIAKARSHGVTVGLGTDVGGGTTLSMLQTAGEAFKVGQLRRQMLDPLQLFYLATLGGARALRMDRFIGNFAPGKEADFLVIDPAATPLLKRRTEAAQSPEEVLFALAILGDDRAVKATYVMGEKVKAPLDKPAPSP